MTSPTAPIAVAGPLNLWLSGDPGPFKSGLVATPDGPGIWTVRLTLDAPTVAPLPAIAVNWALPLKDIHFNWNPGRGTDRGLRPDFADSRKLTAKATRWAPVQCLYSMSDENRLTFALDDALHPAKLSAGVQEESGRLTCAVEILAASHPAGRHFEWTIRLDFRPVSYSQAIGAVADWWASLPGYAPAAVPDVGRLPMYSTWYSFHQSITAAGVEEQCRLAKAMGCEAVIVDDGWQTLDSQRGYAFCGDWQPDRLPDMAAHVARVHDLGMKYILWYSVPFVGLSSKACERFEGKFLRIDKRMGAGVLDPRFPEVREFLIDTYERAMRDWDLDGFKLDFLDAFSGDADTPTTATAGRDLAGIDEAVDRLLSDVIARLRAIKPDVMVEFRQSYIGPLMRKYGNLFRAGDCPSNLMANRVSTIDLRLLAGSTAVHADMLMWHPEDPVESAALQLLAVLFSVPQISVMIDRIPADHQRMLRFWLAFWREHRDCLLDGHLDARHPHDLYPVVSASTAKKLIAAVYTDAVLTVNAPPTEVFVVNATRGTRVVIELAKPMGQRRLRVRNVVGDLVMEETVDLAAGAHAIPIPPAGLAEFAVA